MIPSIITAKHLDFFKAEPLCSLCKYKPGIFDDGMLKKMDASFLKAFLNPSETWNKAIPLFRLFLREQYIHVALLIGGSIQVSVICSPPQY